MKIKEWNEFMDLGLEGIYKGANEKVQECYDLYCET